jgi:Xaa-Pro aminopeptidase
VANFFNLELMSQNRLHSALKILRTHRCTHLLVSDTVDVEYISGFSSSNVLLLISPKNRLLFTDFRYQEAADGFCKRERSWEFVLIKQDDYSALAAHVPPRSRIGFQSDVVTVEELARMEKAVAGATFVPLSAEISDIAIPKAAAEIAAMKKAAAIGDKAFHRILRTLKPGVTEEATARALDRCCGDLGSEKPSFETIVLFGARSAMPHGKPGPARLKKGDFALFDFGCTVNGFCSDMTRTVVAGKPSARQRELYGLVKRAQAAARKAARPGMAASALDAVARTMIADAGFGEAFGHGLGHGVGRRIHERPRVSSKSTAILQAGSVITIEPGIYLPGVGGVRIEDMALLTPNGARILTGSPRELIEV